MKDKVVLITGSGGGIGKATAIAFCKKGAKVVLNGRNVDKLAKTEKELKEKGYNVTAFTGDVTDLNDCQKLIAHTTPLSRLFYKKQ